jgi:hypothetical protein
MGSVAITSPSLFFLVSLAPVIAVLLSFSWKQDLVLLFSLVFLLSIPAQNLPTKNMDKAISISSLGIAIKQC